MTYYSYITSSSQDLEHHGILGMKWGVRRYQNKDGSLTSAGKKHYGFKGTGKTRKELFDEKQEIYKSEFSKDKERLNTEKQKIIDYGKKHNLDLDDGGGGSAKAGSTYMEMWEKYEADEAKASSEAWKRAGEKFVDKYGKETIDSLYKVESRVEAMKFVGTVAGISAAAILLSKRR